MAKSRSPPAKQAHPAAMASTGGNGARGRRAPMRKAPIDEHATTWYTASAARRGSMRDSGRATTRTPAAAARRRRVAAASAGALWCIDRLIGRTPPRRMAPTASSHSGVHRLVGAHAGGVERVDLAVAETHQRGKDLAGVLP